MRSIYPRSRVFPPTYTHTHTKKKLGCYLSRHVAPNFIHIRIRGAKGFRFGRNKLSAHILKFNVNSFFIGRDVNCAEIIKSFFLYVCLLSRLERGNETRKNLIGHRHCYFYHILPVERSVGALCVSLHTCLWRRRLRARPVPVLVFGPYLFFRGIPVEYERLRSRMCVCLWYITAI